MKKKSLDPKGIIKLRKEQKNVVAEDKEQKEQEDYVVSWCFV